MCLKNKNLTSYSQICLQCILRLKTDIESAETLLNSNSDGDATEESEAMDTSEGGAVGGKKKQTKY